MEQLKHECHLKTNQWFIEAHMLTSSLICLVIIFHVLCSLQISKII